MKQTLFIALKGMAMGMAEVVPGVSGGTIAFITGIYERLINAIKSVGPQAINAFRADGVKGVWQAIDGNFLMALVGGMLVGLVVGVFGISHLLENYPILLWAFFFGLIVASALYIGRQVTNWRIVEIIALIIGAAIAYYITIAVPAQGNEALWFVFISGAIAISALLLPGISGSFILLLMGMYTFIIPTAKDALTTFNSDSLIILVVFALGCAVGLVTFSRILSWTFKHYKNPTLALLTGFMIGSLNKIWPWRIPQQWLVENEADEYILQENSYELYQTAVQKGEEIKLLVENNVSPSNFTTITGDTNYMIGAIVTAILGFALVFVLERLGK